MSSEPKEKKADVRAAIEWAWLNYDECIIRDDRNLATAIDFEKATDDPPEGGKQFLDLAFTNKVAFYKDFVMKALGTDADEDDEKVVKEKKSIAEMKELLNKFEEAKK
tara:strand:+ start:955 stop:1278 length:324 start_codon:yes stop_codon:yes gene_type:complete